MNHSNLYNIKMGPKFMSNLFHIPLIPFTVIPREMPWPSTRRVRFVPDLLLSVGFGPILFSPTRCFCYYTIHWLPFPVDTNFFIILFLDHQSTYVWILHLVSIPDICHVQYWMHQDFVVVLPLTSSTCYVEDSIHCLSIIYSSILGRRPVFFFLLGLCTRRGKIWFHNSSGIS